MFGSFLDEHPLITLMKGTMDCPFPSFENRSVWNSLPADRRQDLLDTAAFYRRQPYPMTTATQFMAFVRNGSRKAHEDPYFFRRRKLCAAFLDCCITGTEEDLDDVINGLWCICEESSWVISAHNCNPHPGTRPAAEKPLPDVQNPYIDLFSAQTAMILSLVCSIMRQSLDAVTPMLCRRVAQEIESRIILPFMNHDDFWWMGFIRKDMNNWTPWILSNIMLTATLCIRDRLRLSEILSRAARMLDSYLDVMPEDGGCDEGAGYWNMAGGALLDCLDLLERITDGQMTFWQNPKIRNIMLFPALVQLGNGWFINFADCDARPQLSGERLQFAGERLQEPRLTAMGAALRREASFQLADTPQLWRLLNELFTPRIDMPVQEAVPDVWLPDLQVRIIGKAGLTLAMKGGTNGENHNHNDIGSLILFADGEPVLVDAGNMVYTSKTFSDQRYTLWNTRSGNHNVPLINGFEQSPGVQYHADKVLCTPSGMEVSFASAYSSEAGVTDCRRSAVLEEDGSLSLTDHISGKAGSVIWVFMLRNKPEISGSRIRSGPLEWICPDGLKCAVAEIPVTDPRMARNYPGSLWRLTLEDRVSADHHLVLSFRRK